MDISIGSLQEKQDDFLQPLPVGLQTLFMLKIIDIWCRFLSGRRGCFMIKSKRNFMAALFGTAVLLPTFKLPTPATVYDHLKCCWTWYEAKEILNGAPVRKSDIASRQEGDFTILTGPNDRDLIRLNPAAARIWTLCNGINGVEAMVRTITEDYIVTPRACATDVVLTLMALKRRNLISC